MELQDNRLFAALSEMTRRPEPWSAYTARDLWDDPYISARMLEFHLADDLEPASRNHAFIARSLAWIKQRFNLGPGTKVCDFGCGPGLYGNPLARAGAQVTGLDFSRRSIEHAAKTARAQGLGVEYILGDYLEFVPSRKYDLIIMIYCDLGALNPEQRKRLYRVFRQSLAPGGSILFDVFSQSFFEQAEERHLFEPSPHGGFWSGEPFHLFSSTFKYPRELLYLDKHTVVEEKRTRVIYNWLACFTPETLQRELTENGLAPREFLGNVAGDALTPECPEIAVVAGAA